MAKTDRELILLGKRRVVEQAYLKISCWECPAIPKNPICDFCSKLDTSLYCRGLDFFRGLSDEEVKKLYKEIEEYETL